MVKCPSEFVGSVVFFCGYKLFLSAALSMKYILQSSVQYQASSQCFMYSVTCTTKTHLKISVVLEILF